VRKNSRVNRVRNLRSRASAILFAGVLFGCAAYLWSQPLPSPSVTRIVYYMPGSNLSDTGRQGYCWTGSIAAPFRGDGWRCMAENSIFDPCFTIGEGAFVACGANPAAAEPGFLLTLNQPLPTVGSLQRGAAPDNIWLLLLPDGNYCTRFTGTRPFVGKRIASFGCTSRDPQANVILLDEPDTRRSLWLVSRATLADSPSGWKIKTLETVPVQSAWK